MVEEETLLAVAKKIGFPIALDLKDFPLVKKRESPLPYSFAKEHGVLPLEEREDLFVVALSDPLEVTLLAELRLLLKKEISPVVCPRASLEEAINLCFHQKEEEMKKLFSGGGNKQKFSKEEEEESEGFDLLERKEENPPLKMLNALLIEAIQQGASDIHLEPQEKGLQVRYRLDGVLQKRRVPPKEFQEQILTRLKVLARLDIAEKRLPQDGRIKLRMGGREIDFRVSTMPVVYGERIVLRILDKSNVLLGLDQIGMDSELLMEFRKMLSLPEGIILVTGPTGSGKTTTLYSAISELSSSEMNIMTIEDPVEYKLANIAQIGVNPKIGLDFATGLRHILRQDPDVILVGEIRDRETAEIAIHAALTGHLVFSTLHTNDAPSALTRLVDMGIEPYLLSSSVIGVLAQRLVRKICPLCATAYLATKEELHELKLEKRGKLFRGKGCSHCFETGYRGRHGIYEFLKVTSPIKKQILLRAEAEELRMVAGKDLKDLRYSGAALVAKGITTSREVLYSTRMCGETEADV